MRVLDIALLRQLMPKDFTEATMRAQHGADQLLLISLDSKDGMHMILPYPEHLPTLFIGESWICTEPSTAHLLLLSVLVFVHHGVRGM